MGVIRKVPKDCHVFFGWLLNNISREIEKHHAMRKCQFCKIVVFPYFRIFDILSCLSRNVWDVCDHIRFAVPATHTLCLSVTHSNKRNYILQTQGTRNSIAILRCLRWCERERGRGNSGWVPRERGIQIEL